MIPNNMTKVTWNADGAITYNSCDTVWNTVSTIADTTYVTDCVSSKACCGAHEHTPVKKEEAPKDAKNLLVTKEKRLKVKNCKDGYVESTKDIMPNIKDISVKADGVNSTVIFVTFTDGKTEKAVLDPDDDFSLEHGLTIIMLEKLLSDKGVDGKSVHNKLVKHAIKFYKHQEDERVKAAELKKAEKEKKKRIEEKIRVRKAKKARAEREYQIEMHKEAYLRALNEMVMEGIKHE
jgi:hypothetical protein